jgi:hypothetical protein
LPFFAPGVARVSCIELVQQRRGERRVFVAKRTLDAL